MTAADCPTPTEGCGCEPVTTVRHNIGKCPACRASLWAEVDLTTRVSPPTLDADGKPRVYARPEFLGMRLEHCCRRDDDGEWEDA